MTIRPSEIPTAAELDQMAKAEKEFDQYLIERFQGPDLYCNLPSCLPFRHRFIFLDRYRKVGWRVYFKESSVDGAPEGPYFGRGDEP